MTRWLSVLFRLLQHPLASRQRRLVGERAWLTEDRFVSHFPNSSDIASEVWRSLQREAVVENFRVAPSDDLFEVFGMADDDVEELVLELLGRFDCRVPAPSETKQMPEVRTASDVVGFVAEMRDQ